jgi:CelD/BcsL family acetyltransferase involved in cellulose biosynthesis
MTTATLEPRPGSAPFTLERRRFADIPRGDWERLYEATPHATPFASWTFHRAWWDAYADTATDHYLVTDPLRAIVPLMVRDVPGEGRSVFMGASYHADYATILAQPADVPAAAAALASVLVPAEGFELAGAVDSIDLRRLRADDPALPQLHDAFQAAVGDREWRVERVKEDVCPVLSIAIDWEGQLAAMARVARHELRRKLRRAEASGPLRLEHMPLERATIDRFIDLHQARWGRSGLFADTDDGERSRRFIRRLTELEAEAGAGTRLLLTEVAVGDRVIASTVAFDDGVTCYFYNAGLNPSARELSPGVVATALLIRDRLAAGRRRFDFLRGDERYKYEWGAVDEVVERIVVRKGPTS